MYSLIMLFDDNIPKDVWYCSSSSSPHVFKKSYFKKIVNVRYSPFQNVQMIGNKGSANIKISLQDLCLQYAYRFPVSHPNFWNPIFPLYMGYVLFKATKAIYVNVAS